MLNIYNGGTAPSIIIVYNWFWNSNVLETLLSNNKFHNFVIDVKRPKIRKIASAVDSSNELVQLILKKNLNRKELERLTSSKAGLPFLQRNPQYLRSPFTIVRPKDSPNNGMPAESLHQKREQIPIINLYWSD